MKKLQLLLLAAMVYAMPPAKAQMYSQGDLTLMQNMSATHDSTMCESTCTNMYTFTVSNSFMNDVVKIVNVNTQQLIHTEVNTTGQNPWTFMYNGPLFSSVKPDHQVSGNTVIFAGPTVKAINGTDTIFNINNFFSLNVWNPCQYGNVSGRVFIDNNNDCTYNTGDVPLNQVGVIANATMTNNTTGAAEYTDTAGMYDIQVQESWLVNYNVLLNPSLFFLFQSTTCSGPYTYTTLPQTGVDFALQCTSNIDVQCDASSQGYAQPTFPFFLSPFVNNTGCDPASGTMTLVLDPEVVYDPNLSSNPATTVNGDTLIWNFNNLSNVSNGSYWNSFFSSIHLTPTNNVSIGDTLCFRVYTNNITGDINMANNDHSFCIPVVAAYDPNMKEVSPKGEGTIGGIPPSTSTLTYTVHFQNTGTATAYNISITDTLDGDIDETTLKIHGASHSMTPMWLAPDVVQFNFYGIMLPDSGANEPASHGFVKFSVDLNSGLSIGTQIKNTAYIYFDSNPAIVTNTALNTIAWPSSVAGVNATSNNVFVYPNPASDIIHIDGEEVLNGSACITDISGKMISNTTLSSNKTTVDVSKLPSGVYFLRIASDNHTSVRKFTKQ